MLQLYQQATDRDVHIEVMGSERYHFAITGRSFAVVKKYFPDVIDRVVVRGTIFARMAPDQKSALVEHMQDLG